MYMCVTKLTLCTGNMDTTCKPNTPDDVVDTQSNSSPGPKHVTFDLPESSLDKTKADLTNKIPVSTGKLHNESETIHVTSTNATPDSQQPRLERYKKGLNARFLRHNPRYINEPICHVLPNETSSSVQDCLQWEPTHCVQSNPQRKMYVCLTFVYVHVYYFACCLATPI